VVSEGKYSVKDKVTVIDIGCGWVSKVWKDPNGVELYNVLMCEAKTTADGWFLARDYELVNGWGK
jgi:hypothetical protein